MKTYIFENKETFPIYPLTISHLYTEEKISRPYGTHFHQLFIVSKGSGKFIADNETYPLTVGDMFFIKKDYPHKYEGDDDFKTTFLGFDGSICSNLFKFYNIENYGVFHNKHYREIEQSVFDFYSNFENIRNPAILSANTYSIVCSFFDKCIKTEPSPIAAVKNYIEANYHNPITIEDILEIYPYSRTKLYRDFMTEYGMTIFDMIINVRLRHAEHLLRKDPCCKLSNVAGSCGFNDTSYFCKVYKRIYHKSPKEKTLIHKHN